MLLIGLLGASCAVFDKLSFRSLEYLIRDSLQYLNSTKNIDKSIVTLNINTFSKYNFKHPHTLDTFKKVIDKLQESKPRYILIMMEPIDLLDTEKNKKEIFAYFKAQKNIYLNAYESSSDILSFNNDPIFKNYPNLINIVLCKDSDKKNRRTILFYNNKGPAEIIENLKKLGLNPKEPDFYEYSWNFWETKQVYIKNYKLGTFGYYQSDDLLDDKILNSTFENKVVLIGTHDEYTFLLKNSIFNTFVDHLENNLKEYFHPFQDVIADNINLFTTGDYVKLLDSVNDMLIIFFILLILILLNIPPLKKLYLFLSLLPAIIIFEIILYASTSFYINFSKSMAFLFFSQYLAIPIIMLTVFKSQEQKKLQEINDARIDSLLLVSEKVAHDIRSPLSAVNLILSKVKIDNSEHKEILNNSLKRIDETADKILTKYKTTTSSKSEIFEPINVVESIEALIAEKKIIDPKIKYTFDHPENEKLLVLGHKIELERILSNILDNSIFALKNKEISPEIIFKSIPEKKFIKIQIKDNGIGIPSGVLTLLGKDRITTKSNEKGNGIGLLHAKRVIERMNGTFEVNSIEGQETTVTITLKTVNHNDTHT